MKELSFYNFLTRQVEKFIPLNPKKVGLYTCGPTVYNSVHIGNLRTYLFEDFLRRTLEFNDYQVTHVMNITDIEDKIIKKMAEEGKKLSEVTDPYTESFLQDLEILNIEKAQNYPKATEHIPQMVQLIQTLLDKGFAYQKDGSVYFSLEKFAGYGKLSDLDKRTVKVGARVDVDEYEKDSAEDFVLWKKTVEGEPSFEAPFGKGRPGWHIECSAMSMKYLGESFDIHAGAIDLLFPHHENEIAQSEAATGKKFVNYWLEGEHLLVNNQKMAKSLGNVFTLEDLVAKGFDPLAFRYLTLTTHYQSRLNFTWESLQGAQNALHNLYEIVSGLPEAKIGCAEYEKRFQDATGDNLDLPKAIAITWELLKSDYPPEVKAASVLKFDQVLGLKIKDNMIVSIPEDVQILVKKREQLRQDGRYDQADKIREEIEKAGYSVLDNSTGVKVLKRYN